MTLYLYYQIYVVLTLISQVLTTASVFITIIKTLKSENAMTILEEFRRQEEKRSAIKPQQFFPDQVEVDRQEKTEESILLEDCQEDGKIFTLWHRFYRKCQKKNKK